jgi:Bacterial extracellular solute-binding proteins, family 5 Middle
MTIVFERLSKALSLAAVGLGLVAAPASGKDIVWARYGDIDTLDPQRATSTLSLQVWSLIYDTLLATDKNGSPIPNLAQSWTANDAGTEYTFKLHEGVKCHDGSPLDANDVKYTVDRAFDEKNPSVTKASWGPIESISVVDPLTVKFRPTHFLRSSAAPIGMPPASASPRRSAPGRGSLSLGPRATRSSSRRTRTTSTSASWPRIRALPIWSG